MEIKAVGTKALRDRFTLYLREVRRGVRILVLDHDKVVAELREPTESYIIPADQHTITRWEREGVLIRPKTARPRCEPSPLRSPAGTAGRLVDADRNEDGTRRV